MALIDSKDLAATMAEVIRDPNNMQILALNSFERIRNGEQLVLEASNPFAYSLEISCLSASVAAEVAETALSKAFQKMTTNEKDLYLHMSGPDYLNRFSKPGNSSIGFLFSYDEIVNRAVPLNDGSGSKQLIIPKNTTVYRNDVYFTIQYPILITVMNSNTVKIQLDTTNKSPVFVPETNDVNWKKTWSDGQALLYLEVPAQQMQITSTLAQLTAVTGFNTSYTFNDLFYFARAYIQNTAGQWVEIQTQHNSTVYDSSTPTVCLSVVGNTLNVYIPQIYFANNTIGDAVRIDIYTTKGAVDYDFSNSSFDEFKYKFVDLDNSDLSPYSKPLTSLSMVTSMVRKPSTGGAGPLTFAELKQRVVERSATTAGLPIAPNQLVSTLSDQGYETITSLDSATNRQIAAVRSVPAPTDGSTVTPLGCCIDLVRLSISQLATTSTALDSNDRVVLTPQNLFLNDGSSIKLLGDSVVAGLKTLASNSPEGITNQVNSNNYLYTPFHYVLDSTNDTFSARPYYMTSPTVLNRFIYKQNDSLGLDLRSSTYQIATKPDGTGYYVYVTLANNPSLGSFNADGVTVQLSFSPKNSQKRAWIKGRLAVTIDPNTSKPVNDQWIYVFDIKTDYDIDTDQQLHMVDSGYRTGLTHEFDVVVAVKNFAPTGSTTSDIDNVLNKDYIDNYQYTDMWSGATQEKININFGQYMERLWHRTRQVPGQITYRTYANDVPAVYTRDVYRTDINGNIIVHYDYNTSTPTYEKIHSAGDPILDAQGNPTLLHRKGALIRDSITNDPIPVQNNRELVHQLDLFLVDGKYYFATDDSTLAYVKTSLDTVADWVNDDMVHLQQRMIERTDLYYYPKSMVGQINVIVGDGTTVRTKSDSAITVTYTLSNTKLGDEEFRTSLENKTAQLVLNAINALVKVNAGIITKNELNTTVKRLSGADIIDVDVDGFFPTGYTSLITTSVSSIPSIGKKLVTLSNLSLQVQDAVYTEFKYLGSDTTSAYLSKQQS